ncbi:MAG: hypothetical protein Kow0099_02070 [Candidatus Abyssubacteria bacterium]
MEMDKKLVAAIGAGVSAYIQAQQASERPVRERPPQPGIDLWRQSGRQEIMRHRQMWQLRIVPR